ncbi:hypothetical protein MG293_015309 [Ovis ammon polii]|uniref:Uncharacterized protein n=1 Tax=Ovis ammon polii TaxID=230172 RepID=A0AAD4TXY5_OVIAM|nr:hypothetical protein MG293_015309 [Ovis ammon polii]
MKGALLVLALLVTRELTFETREAEACPIFYGVLTTVSLALPPLFLNETLDLVEATDAEKVALEKTKDCFTENGLANRLNHLRITVIYCPLTLTLRTRMRSAVCHMALPFYKKTTWKKDCVDYWKLQSHVSGLSIPKPYVIALLEDGKEPWMVEEKLSKDMFSDCKSRWENKELSVKEDIYDEDLPQMLDRYSFYKRDGFKYSKWNSLTGSTISYLVTGEVIQISDWDFTDNIASKRQLNAVYVSGFTLWHLIVIATSRPSQMAFQSKGFCYLLQAFLFPPCVLLCSHSVINYGSGVTSFTSEVPDRLQQGVPLPIGSDFTSLSITAFAVALPADEELANWASEPTFDSDEIGNMEIPVQVQNLTSTAAQVRSAAGVQTQTCLRAGRNRKIRSGQRPFILRPASVPRFAGP